jgi:K+-sensing histidine kinase KdpD
MPPQDASSRAERLLQKMHRVFSHDLPNQIVVLQRLVQMLERDETGRLSDAGRDYLGRLGQAANKTAGLVGFLREVGRLHGYERHVENVSLASVIRQVTVELHEALPEAPVQCELAGDVQAINADPRLLTRALVELTRCLLERSPDTAGRLRLLTQRGANAIELRGELSWAGRVRSPRTTLDQRLELVLAQECLAAWQASVREVREAVDHSRFIVHVPL